MNGAPRGLFVGLCENDGATVGRRGAIVGDAVDGAAVGSGVGLTVGAWKVACRVISSP